uniref:ATP synthase complex subunit 8 n=1 Tax=Oreodytes davisii TaxID=156968 RepID=A0A894JQW7_9DYTI|nr:ATP synthase F0 subunit 8 [Oreodytes davisii]QRV62819.1 ATP synthase F0 subunit 8 [Oreodytes davisii]
MPQMAPMNWLLLYIFFSVIFILFNFMNYYTFLTYKKINFFNKSSKKILSWKW